jgi:hypothetical protein
MIGVTLSHSSPRNSSISITGFVQDDAETSESVGTEMFLDGTISGTSGVGGADSFALFVSFVLSGTKIAAATGGAADTATGALVVAGMSSDGVF